VVLTYPVTETERRSGAQRGWRRPRPSFVTNCASGCRCGARRSCISWLDQSEEYGQRNRIISAASEGYGLAQNGAALVLRSLPFDDSHISTGAPSTDGALGAHKKREGPEQQRWRRPGGWVPSMAIWRKRHSQPASLLRGLGARFRPCLIGSTYQALPSEGRRSRCASHRMEGDLKSEGRAVALAPYSFACAADYRYVDHYSSGLIQHEMQLRRAPHLQPLAQFVTNEARPSPTP